jgi:hypothetical protein
MAPFRNYVPAVISPLKPVPTSSKEIHDLKLDATGSRLLPLPIDNIAGKVDFPRRFAYDPQCLPVQN